MYQYLGLEVYFFRNFFCVIDGASSEFLYELQKSELCFFNNGVPAAYLKNYTVHFDVFNILVYIGHSCRSTVFRLKKDFETPDLAWESWGDVEEGNPFVCDFKKLQEEDRIDVLDKLFQIHLKDIGMEGYCPGNIPSLSLLAMNALKVAKRPNTVANLITCLTGTFADDTERLDINRMPYPLIETNLSFFSSEMRQSVKIHDSYHQWLQTMYAHFGEKFVALFTGPMWKVQENDSDHRRILEKAFCPAANPVEENVTDLSPGRAQPKSTSKNTQEQSKQDEFTTSTPLRCEEPCSSWMAADLEEIRASQREGISVQQQEKKLLRHHGLQKKQPSKPKSSATKDVSQLMIVFYNNYI